MKLGEESRTRLVFRPGKETGTQLVFRLEWNLGRD